MNMNDLRGPRRILWERLKHWHDRISEEICQFNRDLALVKRNGDCDSGLMIQPIKVEDVLPAMPPMPRYEE